MRPRFLLAVVLTLAFTASAWAALPGGKAPGPMPIGPEPESIVNESSVRFSWAPLTGATNYVLLVSSTPFDARAWTDAPTGEAIRVYRTSGRVASLKDVGLTLDEDTKLYWAVGSATREGGPLTFSDTRSTHVLQKFKNRVTASPYLETSPVTRFTPERPEGPARIRLAAGFEIDPAVGEPVLPRNQRLAAQPVNGRRTYLVHYGDQDPDRARNEVMASGGEIAAYVSDHTFLVRMPAGGTLAKRDGWVGDYQPAYKLSRSLDLLPGVPYEATVVVFNDGDLAAVRSAAEAAGATTIASSSNGINKILRLSGSGPTFEALAGHPDVAWIERHVRNEAFNGVAQYIVQTYGASNRRVWDMGIQGQGQVIHTSDTGIDMTHEMFNDLAVPVSNYGSYPTHRKVISYDDGSLNPGAAFGDHGDFHGTHTAGSVAGSPATNFPGYDGQAKQAKIWHSDLSGAALGTGLDPLPDLNDIFEPSYLGNAGGAARISSSSWGAPVNGTYTVDSWNVDQFMWNHPDYLIMFANGNSGPTFGTVGSPATAKNSVGVGGTRNSPTLGTTAKAIYSGTSRGPTDDGRRKPTICAPGQGVTSSVQGPSGYASYTGTSMASPTAAGLTALIRQYLTEGWYPTGTKVPANGFTPSAALLKAMLVNSAVNDVTSFVAPDNSIGFGRILADSVLYFAGDKRRLLLVDNTEGLGNGEQIEYKVNVVHDSTTFEVTLCWTDYPGNPAVLNQLVNNLNLTVTNGVVTYRGNVYSGGFSAVGGSYDNVNVEEAVQVRFPTPGMWTVRVQGANVAAGPQPFALAITGGVGINAGLLALDRANYAATSTVEIQVVDHNAGPSVNVSLTSNSEPGGEVVNIPGANGVYTGSISLSPLLGAVGDGTLRVSHGDVITATYNDALPVASLVSTATVSMLPPLITNVGSQAFPDGRVTLSWTTDKNASTQVYYGLTPALGSASTLDPIGAIGHATTLSGLVAGGTYYYDVESTDLIGNTTRDDNGGQHYRFTVSPKAEMLLVYTGPPFERDSYYTTTLGELGWFYETWSGDASDTPKLGDLSSGMRSYDVVWWQAGLESYPAFSDVARDTVSAYLDGGGRLAVVGHDVAWGMADPTSPYYTVDRAAFINNTLRTGFVADPGNWNNVGGVPSDPISGAYVSPGTIPYAAHRAGADGDEVSPLSSAVGSWLSGDGTPLPAGIRWESPGPAGTPGSGVWGGMNSRLATMNFEWSGLDYNTFPSSAIRRDVMKKTLAYLLGRNKPEVTVTAPNGGETIVTTTTNITWSETFDGTSAAGRTLEYSLDNGNSWTVITTSAGASPYVWDLSGVPNTTLARVRVRVSDDGTPAFTGADVSNAVFTLNRVGGDVVGPAVVAGSIQSSPTPIVNTGAATLNAQISDVLNGGSSITAAEWSRGPLPLPAGTATPMTGTFSSSLQTVTASLPTSLFAAGTTRLWVRGRDAANNWGPASALTILVNGHAITGVDPEIPKSLALAQNTPNPLHTSTLIGFGLPKGGRVQLSIFDVSGRRVRDLANGSYPAGSHSVAWDRADENGRIVKPGVYYYQLNVAGTRLQKKMVVLD